jgi:ABC-type spermidine/putrescine transport system permease subunit I
MHEAKTDSTLTLHNRSATNIGPPNYIWLIVFVFMINTVVFVYSVLSIAAVIFRAKPETEFTSCSKIGISFLYLQGLSERMTFW